MAKNIPLTLACGNYEIVRSLIDGTVSPDGIDLTILTDMDSTTRHWRFLREGHFDVCETSCSSYIVGRDKGLAITAIPVFLHRRFRHGFVFINTSKGIKQPKDLIGKKIGIKSFLVTAIHWMRGILESEYGVSHKSVEWVAELDEDEAKELLESVGITEPGLEQLAHKGFNTLGLQTYLTAGPKETRAWTIGKGWTAPMAAGVIHTDFQKGFIKAEIISFDDLVECGSVAEARAKGKARMEGKDYVMQDGDVVEFRFNV